MLDVAGPFALYGDPIVEACVRHRTDYVDITGETTWVHTLIDRFHGPAAANGTRIVPCCGFDSVPSDLGAFLAVRALQQLGADPQTVKAYFTGRGGLNGGTVASPLELVSDPAKRVLLRDPFLLNPAPPSDPAAPARNADPLIARFDADACGWTSPFFMGPINTRVVRRSAALYASYGETYGSRFRYQENLSFGPAGGLAASLVAGSSFFFDTAVTIASARALLRAVLPKPGAGPSEREMRDGRFRCRLVGIGRAASAPGHCCKTKAIPAIARRRNS